MVERLENEVILSLGSNLGQKKKNLRNCIKKIQEHIGEVKSESKIIESAPFGFESDNDFANMCVKVETNLTAEFILQEIQLIEKKMGRTRTQKNYEDRIIDIDIILLNNQIIETKNLTIPHQKYRERTFVLIPLLELGNFLDPQLFLTTEEFIR